MTATELLADLGHLGIQLEAHCDRLRFRPRAAVTPEMLDRLITHKPELLEILTPDAGADNDDQPWVEEYDSDGHLWLVNPQHMDSFRLEAVDPPDPCPLCGTLELWQTCAGNWRCLRCDPPTVARRLRERRRGTSGRKIEHQDA